MRARLAHVLGIGPSRQPGRSRGQLACLTEGLKPLPGAAWSAGLAAAEEGHAITQTAEGKVVSCPDEPT